MTPDELNRLLGESDKRVSQLDERSRTRVEQSGLLGRRSLSPSEGKQSERR